MVKRLGKEKKEKKTDSVVYVVITYYNDHT